MIQKKIKKRTKNFFKQLVRLPFFSSGGAVGIVSSTGKDFNYMGEMRSLCNFPNSTDVRERGLELLALTTPPHDAIELALITLFQRGQIEAVMSIAIQAASKFPGRYMYEYFSGLGLRAQGKEMEACNYLKRALQVCPSHRPTIRQYIEAVAASYGVDESVSRYKNICPSELKDIDIIVAPVESVVSWAHQHGVPYFEVGVIEEVLYLLPPVFGDKESVPHKLYASSNQPYVAEVPNARIFGESSIILTGDGIALSDTGGHRRYGKCVNFIYEDIVLAQKKNQLVLEFSDYKSRKVKEAIFLSGMASGAFGHWLPEFLPKLNFLMNHPDYNHLPIIVDAGMPRSHFEHLKRLSNNSLILLENKESILCERLLVSPSPTFFPREVFPGSKIPMKDMLPLAKSAMEFIRGQEVGCPAELRSRRLFISRLNSHGRNLINEEEIFLNLKGLHFERVFPEEMSVSEQIELFKQAEVVVSPNGSALLNLIFSNTETKILILSQANLHNWGTFQGVMESLGYKPLWVCGDYALAETQKHSDYHIDPNRVLEAIRSIGVN
jgi:hypothetical protein